MSLFPQLPFKLFTYHCLHKRLFVCYGVPTHAWILIYRIIAAGAILLCLESIGSLGTVNIVVFTNESERQNESFKSGLELSSTYQHQIQYK